MPAPRRLVDPQPERPRVRSPLVCTCSLDPGDVKVITCGGRPFGVWVSCPRCGGLDSCDILGGKQLFDLRGEYRLENLEPGFACRECRAKLSVKAGRWVVRL